MWNTIQCAVQGKGHIKTETPCQDKTYSLFLNEIKRKNRSKKKTAFFIINLKNDIKIKIGIKNDIINVIYPPIGTGNRVNILTSFLFYIYIYYVF